MDDKAFHLQFSGSDIVAGDQSGICAECVDYTSRSFSPVLTDPPVICASPHKDKYTQDCVMRQVSLCLIPPAAFSVELFGFLALITILIFYICKVRKCIRS